MEIPRNKISNEPGGSIYSTSKNMRNIHPTILAINPGTRYTGIAIFRGSDLLDWGVKVINGKWSDKKVDKIRRIIYQLIKEHQVDALVIKTLHLSRSSNQLNHIRQAVISVAKDNHLKVCEHSFDDLKGLYGQVSKVTKQKIAEMICWQYPILLSKHNREREARNNYHIRMFEAVALGVLEAKKDRTLSGLDSMQYMCLDPLTCQRIEP